MGGLISNGREGSDVSLGGGIKVFINQESASSSLFWRFIATKLSSSHWNRRLRSLQSFNFQKLSRVLGFHRRWGLCLRPQSGQSGSSVLVTFPCSWRGSVVQSASTCNAVTALVRWWQCDEEELEGVLVTSTSLKHQSQPGTGGNEKDVVKEINWKGGRGDERVGCGEFEGGGGGGNMRGAGRRRST